MADHVYIKSEPELWTVGFYNPQGEWVPESDHNSKAAAANKVHFLNGGSGDTFIVEPEGKEAHPTFGVWGAIILAVALGLIGLGIWGMLS